MHGYFVALGVLQLILESCGGIGCIVGLCMLHQACTKPQHIQLVGTLHFLKLSNFKYNDVKERAIFVRPLESLDLILGFLAHLDFLHKLLS